MMKKLGLIFLFFSFLNTSEAQIPNHSFEDWVVSAFYEDVDGYVTSNVEVFYRVTPLTATQVSSPGGSAVLLETVLQPGKLTNGNYWVDGEGGTPYTEQPDTMEAIVKYDIPAGATASIRLEFKAAGVLVAFSQISLTGQEDNYVSMKAPITTFSSAPDMVNLVAKSSADVVAGAKLEIEEINLIGATEQLPNHDFESWSRVESEDPEFWTTYNLSNVIFDGDPVAKMVEGTTPGTFAAEFSTSLNYVFGQPSINGLANTGGVTPGGNYMPLDFQPDALNLDYKYSSIDPDSAIIAVQFLVFPNGQATSLGTFFTGLNEAADWTSAQIDIDLPMDADSFGIFIVPDAQEAFRQVPQIGRTVTVDNLEFDMSTSIVKKGYVETKCFPNPVTDQTRVEWSEPGTGNYRLLNGLALQVQSGVVNGNNLELNVNGLRAGNYYLLIDIEDQKLFVPIVKQ